jgi:hypothetical protein
MHKGVGRRTKWPRKSHRRETSWWISCGIEEIPNPTKWRAANETWQTVEDIYENLK